MSHYISFGFCPGVVRGTSVTRPVLVRAIRVVSLSVRELSVSVLGCPGHVRKWSGLSGSRPGVVRVWSGCGPAVSGCVRLCPALFGCGPGHVRGTSVTRPLVVRAIREWSGGCPGILWSRLVKVFPVYSRIIPDHPRTTPGRPPYRPDHLRTCPGRPRTCPGRAVRASIRAGLKI